MVNIDTLRNSGFLAGQAAAQILDTVSQHGSFTPLMITADGDLSTTLHRLVGDGQDLISMRNDILGKTAYVAAGFLSDGYITLPTGKYDAILISILDPAQVDDEVICAVPYVPKRMFKPFKLHRLKVLTQPDGIDDAIAGTIVEAFWAGIDANPKIGQMWDSLTDASV